MPMIDGSRSALDPAVRGNPAEVNPADVSPGG